MNKKLYPVIETVAVFASFIFLHIWIDWITVLCLVLFVQVVKTAYVYMRRNVLYPLRELARLVPGWVLVLAYYLL